MAKLTRGERMRTEGVRLVKKRKPRAKVAELYKPLPPEIAARSVSYINWPIPLTPYEKNYMSHIRRFIFQGEWGDLTNEAYHWRVKNAVLKFVREIRYWWSL